MDLELTPPWTFSYSAAYDYKQSSESPSELTTEEKSEFAEKYSYIKINANTLRKQKYVSTLTLTLHNKQEKPLPHTVHVRLQPPRYVDRMVGQFATSFSKSSSSVNVSVSPQNQFDFFVRQLPANAQVDVQFNVAFYTVVLVSE